MLNFTLPKPKLGDITAITITYFAKDMKEKIEKLKSSGITEYIKTEGSVNITLTTPEKQQLNLFNLGM